MEIEVQRHAGLAGLLGGNVAEQYHLTAAEHTELTNWMDSVILDTDGSMDLGTATIQFWDAAVTIGSADDGHFDINADISVDVNCILLDIDSGGTTTGFNVNATTISRFLLREAGVGAGFEFVCRWDRDQTLMALGERAGRHIVICDLASDSMDFDHAIQTHPTLYVHSVTNPNDNNTEWGSLVFIGDGAGNGAFTFGSGTDLFEFIGDVVQTGAGRILESTKYKLTAIGGVAARLTNKTGGNTVAGQLVITSAAADDAFTTAGANGDNMIGIVLDAGIADGSEAWVVMGGIADVLIDAGGSAAGDRLISSATAGSADVWNVGGAVATHFLEVGHCLETRVGAGLARCAIHFN